MKNKHLVLLFLLTLLVGLAVRRAPWRNSAFFQTNLLKLDTAALQQIQITLPGKPALFLLRGDGGWTAEQLERSASVPAETTLKMLSALADLRSIRIVKTQRPDTLGFSPDTGIQVSIGQEEHQNETLSIGREILENNQPATFVQLPRHEGIYLVNNHLRDIFSKSLADFRDRTIARFSPTAVQSVAVLGRGMDTILLQRTAVAETWANPLTGQIHPDDSVQFWLTKLLGLQGLNFSNLFDETYARQNLYAEIRLQLDGQPESLVLRIFKLNPPNLPEELPTQKPDKRQFAPFVLHSSQNQANYFTLQDTTLLRQICRPF